MQVNDRRQIASACSCQCISVQPMERPRTDAIYEAISNPRNLCIAPLYQSIEQSADAEMEARQNCNASRGVRLTIGHERTIDARLPCSLFWLCQFQPFDL